MKLGKMLRKWKRANLDDKGRTILIQRDTKRARQQVIRDLLLACLWFGSY